jgi:ferredoxin--NADP+ reductase
MSEQTIGSEARPLRVAVVGAGPSGFYIVQGLLKAKDLAVSVDLFDRLPAPYGLVRYGVAPDHQNIKAVTKVYARLASDPSVRFFGGVGIGTDLHLEDLESLYDEIVFCSGAQTDRRLGIEGEDLQGSHPATSFVAWYNGHPDYKDLTFELDAERAVVVGVGNVALDVARMLCRTPEELEKTDIADHALAALRRSRVREVVVLGRRGPAQAAFSNAELEELAKMEGANVRTLPAEVALDDESRADVETSGDKRLVSKVETLEAYSREPGEAKPKTLWLRFLVAPTRIVSDHRGRVAGVTTIRNRLVRRADGTLRPQATEESDEIEAGLVFRSVGYRGVPIPGVPFREDWGTIPNDAGRVLQAPGGAVRPKLYVAGWIKRGPSGVIGTNRPDALETVGVMLEDMRFGRIEGAKQPDPTAVGKLLSERGVRWFTFDDWTRLDTIEVERGRPLGRPRVKLITREEMLAALD